MKERYKIIFLLLFTILFINGCGGSSTTSQESVIRYGVGIFTDDGIEYKVSAWFFTNGSNKSADIVVCGKKIPTDQTKVSLGTLKPGDPVPVHVSYPDLGGIGTTLKTPGTPVYTLTVAELNQWFKQSPPTSLTINWTDTISLPYKGGVYITDKDGTCIAQEPWFTLNPQMIIDSTKSANLINTPGATGVLVRVYGYDVFTDKTHSSEIYIAGPSVDLKTTF